jgi:hypothetical protein
MGERREGGCFCGGVRYALTAAPMFTHCCHCRDCQSQTGGAFAINALIETDHIELIKGEPKPVRMPTESGRVHDIYRCEACATAVWSDYGGRPKLRFVRVSTLDEPHAIEPDAHIFTRSKVPWVVLPQGQAAFEVSYDLESQWPAESLARRAAISA